MAAMFEQYATDDGAYGSKNMDLFPTVVGYMLAQTLGLPVGNRARLRRAIQARQTPTGGLGAQPGQPADGWSTSYGIQTLLRAGLPIPQPLDNYILLLAQEEGGFSMAASQDAEVWSTALIVGALISNGTALPHEEKTFSWLESSRCPSGGFTWSPVWVDRNRADVRATRFAIGALDAMGRLTEFDQKAGLKKTVEYLKKQQGPSGGFALDSRHPECLWGTGDAVRALAVLGEPPDHRGACLRFIEEYNCGNGGYRRGADYPDHADIWATNHAYQARLALGDEITAAERLAAGAFLDSCSAAEGGYTYRPTNWASDALATSAAILSNHHSGNAPFDFLESCLMPGEGGVGYTPSRGAEARSAMWTTNAFAFHRRHNEKWALERWAPAVQNPDGGFGPWEGRASNAVSTNAVLSVLILTGHCPGDAIDQPAVERWINRAWPSRPIDYESTDLIEMSSLVCAANALGLKLDEQPLRSVLEDCRCDGAWRRSPGTFPDLLATYVALTAHQVLGELGIVLPKAAEWVRSLSTDDSGTAWSKLSRTGGGPVPTALASLILAAESGNPLPNLTL